MKDPEERQSDSTNEIDEQLDPETPDDGVKTVADAWTVALGRPDLDEEAGAGTPK